ncbi:retrovirus-related pol polyprotein from transposon TNT 1-94 [Tanacetum coccineum]
MEEGDYKKEEVQAEEPRQQQPESIATSKPKRNTKRPARLNDTMTYASSIAADDVPTTYSEAVRDVKNENSEDWPLSKKNSISSEESDMGVDQPPRREEGNWMQMGMYVKTTFLLGDLEEEIYMVQLEGFKVAGKAHEVCYVFTLAKAPVSWKSTLQSTTEAEYMAMTEAVKEAIWLQGLFGELGISQKFVMMHSDSQSAIHLAKNQVYHARTKHIDVRYHVI